MLASWHAGWTAQLYAVAAHARAADPARQLALPTSMAAAGLVVPAVPVARVWPSPSSRLETQARCLPACLPSCLPAPDARASGYPKKLPCLARPLVTTSFHPSRMSTPAEIFYDLKKFLEESKAPVPPQLAQHEAAKQKPGAIGGGRPSIQFAKK